MMISDDKKQTKVVRYYGSKYLSENKNLYICVADYHARVVVVSATVKLRVRHTGPLPVTGNLFKPWDITTNSENTILITDFDNQRIHILDQDGRFLRYIDSCCLHIPMGLCVDSEDNLLVAEFTKVKFNI